MSRTAGFVCLAILVIGTASCSGSIKAEGDTSEDRRVDPSVDTTGDVVHDATDTTDATEVGDPAADPPEDHIGMPCDSDEFCDDGLFCNGEEYCHPEGVCRASPAPDCSDDDDCTTDSCNEETDTCDNILIDEDGDTYAPESCGGDDCDDGDSTVHPGADEVCGDGIDQDCDGSDGDEGTCECPVSLPVPGTHSGDTSSASSVYDGSCPWDTGAREIVYEVVTTSTTNLLFMIEPEFGYDAILYLRRNTCDGWEIDCAEPAHNGTTLLVTLESGTYYLFVDGRASYEAGTYDLVADTYTSVTGNDICGSAHAITADGYHVGDNTGATDNADPSTCSSASIGTGGPDVWFSFTLSSSTTVLLETAGSTFDTVLFIRRGSCSGPEVACDDDTGPGATSEIRQALDPDTYYVVLDADDSAETGEYILNVTGL